ncbi:MAG: hypothetical protein JRI55_14650, partial [Deltaproteobacteria bacterium]|nr:hypothetical protein [Deltaproteobacteria bacterium]
SEPFKLRPGNRIQLGAETVLMLTHHSPLESQLVEQQKLEAVGRLAGGVAAEFERLVTSARSHVKALKKEAQAGELKASVLRNRLGEIERRMDDALDLTQQMLSFSFSGKQEEMQIDIGDLINSVVRLARHTTGGEVRFETDIIPDLFVMGDPPQLQQVLMGLCIHARDSIGEGQVTISARHWDPSDSVTPRPQVMSTTHVKITVQDNGKGLHPEACSRIFEPYFTSRNNNRGCPSLAAVYAVVKHHNGHIECISALGEGTTFNVFLPVASEKQASAPTRKAVPAVDTQRLFRKDS